MRALAALVVLAVTSMPVYPAPAEPSSEADYHTRCTCVIGRYRQPVVGLFEDVTGQCSRAAVKHGRKPMDFELDRCDPVLPDHYRRAYDDRPL